MLRPLCATLVLTLGPAPDAPTQPTVQRPTVQMPSQTAPALPVDPPAPPTPPAPTASPAPVTPNSPAPASPAVPDWGAPAPPPPASTPPAAAPAPDPSAAPSVGPVPSGPPPSERPPRPNLPPAYTQPKGAGLIIGGSILTGFGVGMLLVTGLVCGGATGGCFRSGSPEGVAVGTGLTLLSVGGIGGGITMEVVGFRRLDNILEYEHAFGTRYAVESSTVWLATMGGGFLTSSFIGLTSGIITSSIYSARVRLRRQGFASHRPRMRLSPQVTPQRVGLGLSGRF